MGYVQDALDVVNRNVTFKGTDLLYIVPTTEASEISYSPTFMPPIKAADGTIIKKTVTFGHDMCVFGYTVMLHETGHTMGLPDLYSYEPHTRAAIFVGGFDLMANNTGISPDYLAWHKWRLGWIDDNQIACLGRGTVKQHGKRYTLTPIEEATGLKALVFRYNATFAVVAENRSGKGANSAVCGTGVLIYTVSTLVPTGRGPVRVQDSSPQSERCAGEILNHALFVPQSQDRSTYVGWDVNITVVEEINAGFVVQVNGQ